MADSQRRPLSQGAISAVLRELGDDPSIVDRLAWWARYAHASERWLQFELAYRLQGLLGDRYAVACEQRRVDIVFYRLPAQAAPLPRNEYAAGIELKWFATWWIGDCAAKLAKDVAKVEQYQFPALALGIWWIAWPSEASPYHRWIREAADNGAGTRDLQQIQSSVDASVPRKADFEVETPCRHHSDFESLSLWAVGYWNEHARREIQSGG
jgi:hypothetical protein